MLKQVNLSSIRRLMKNKGTVTRAQISWETRISSTTVRSLLAEMQRNGEIESVGYDESTGGRKAERYKLKTDLYYGAAFCITESVIHYIVVNIYGDIVEKGKIEVLQGDIREPIMLFLDNLTTQRKIRSIGIGVPGVVDGGGYLINIQENEINKVDIGVCLSQKYVVPVLLENDLNAITLGFGRCYLRKFPYEHPENINISFVYFDKGCISAGFITGGRIIRGYNNFAGELSVIPADEHKSFGELMLKPMDDSQYTIYVTRIICYICSILNPQYIALGGPYFRKECLGPICEGLYALLPRNMPAEILYSSDIWNDYYEGMAYLTAGQIFNDVQLINIS